jgi:hypothetical protein
LALGLAWGALTAGPIGGDAGGETAVDGSRDRAARPGILDEKGTGEAVAGDSLLGGKVVRIGTRRRDR